MSTGKKKTKRPHEKSRSYMPEMGQSSSSHRCHRAPDRLLQRTVDSNPEISFNDEKELCNAFASKGNRGNLRLQSKEHNQGHLKLENELFDSADNGKSVSSEARDRGYVGINSIINQVDDEKMSRRNAHRLLQEANKSSYKGEGIVEGFKNRRNMRCTSEKSRKVLNEFNNGPRDTPKTRFKDDGSIDLRSASVKNGELRLTKSGNIDQRSSVCRSGDVKVKKDGSVDKRSKAYRSR